MAIDRLKPRIPIFGDIWLKAQIAQFVRTLSTLLGGGTPLVPALHHILVGHGQPLISTSVEVAAGRVKEGKSLHASLAETHLVPALALEMIEVGEASGALSAMLTSVAEFYEEEVGIRLATYANVDSDRQFWWLWRVVVGFILISLYLPMFSLQMEGGRRSMAIAGNNPIPIGVLDDRRRARAASVSPSATAARLWTFASSASTRSFSAAFRPN